MREVELKAVIDDWESCRRRLEEAGARLTFDGRLEDRRLDTPERVLTARDEVLRLRAYRSDRGVTAELGWKGPTAYQGGYKIREELQSSTTDADRLMQILQRLGYVVTRAIDRRIVQYELEGATVRMERYPRMDDLLEVEGTPACIERAIAATGLPRGAFNTERLLYFVTRYQERTGERAALSDAELAGTARYSLEDA